MAVNIATYPETLTAITCSNNRTISNKPKKCTVFSGVQNRNFYDNERRLSDECVKQMEKASREYWKNQDDNETSWRMSRGMTSYSSW